MTPSRHRRSRSRFAAGDAATVSGRLPLAFEPLESRSLLAACCGAPPDGGETDAAVAELDAPVAMPDFVVGFTVNATIDRPVAIACFQLAPSDAVSLAVAGGVPGDDLESASLWPLADEPTLDVQLLDSQPLDSQLLDVQLLDVQLLDSQLLDSQLLDDRAVVAATADGHDDAGAFHLLVSTADSVVPVAAPVPSAPESPATLAPSRQVTQPPVPFRLPVGMAAAFGFGVPGTEATVFTPVGGRRRGR